MDVQLQFLQGWARQYTWALLTLPKKKGSLGLINPIIKAETRLMAQFHKIVSGRKPKLTNMVTDMVTDLLQDNLKCRLEVSLTAIFASPSVATINKVKDYKSFSGRLFSMLLTFRLDLIMEPKWENCRLNKSWRCLSTTQFTHSMQPTNQRQ